MSEGSSVKDKEQHWSDKVRIDSINSKKSPKKNRFGNYSIKQTIPNPKINTGDNQADALIQNKFLAQKYKNMNLNKQKAS